MNVTNVTPSIRRTARFLSFAGLLLLAATSHAVPQIMYRPDARGPDEIFRDGFRPWGNNRNLVSHLEGATCNVEETNAAAGSRYIAVAEQLDRAEYVVRTRLRQMADGATPPPRIWMYFVRADRNFYNAARTYEASGVAYTVGRLRPTYVMANTMGEWDADGGIDTAHIQAAQQYELGPDDRPQAIPGTLRNNPAYVEADTQGNPEPLPPSVMTENGAFGGTRAVIGAALMWMISACYCDHNNRIGPARRSAPVPPINLAANSPPDICQKSITHIENVTPTVRYFPVDGWRVDP